MRRLLLTSLVGALLLALLAISDPALAGSVQLDGSLTQGGLVVGRTAPGSRVELDGRHVRLSDDGVFLMGFGRDAPAHARLLVTSPGGRSESRDLHIAARSYKVQRIDGLPPSKVTPSEEDMVRIRKEIAVVKKARSRDDPRTDFLTGFRWPAKGRISGVYGSQRVLNGEPRRPHFGVDIAAPVGTIVRAPAAGVVTLVHNDMFFSGVTLILDHGHGLSSSFLHLNAILVAEGDRISRGQPIAEIGATGRVTGAHLDWRMNLWDRRLDPQLLVGSMAE
jgi:murein DD-endopeptidase MepM/ murein hydrolase activator NlpD